MTYVLLCALRRIGLAHTQFAAATCGTIRLRLLKLGALTFRCMARASLVANVEWHLGKLYPPRRLQRRQHDASGEWVVLYD